VVEIRTALTKLCLSFLTDREKLNAYSPFFVRIVHSLYINNRCSSPFLFFEPDCYAWSYSTRPPLLLCLSQKIEQEKTKKLHSALEACTTRASARAALACTKKSSSLFLLMPFRKWSTFFWMLPQFPVRSIILSLFCLPIRVWLCLLHSLFVLPCSIFGEVAWMSQKNRSVETKNLHVYASLLFNFLCGAQKKDLHPLKNRCIFFRARKNTYNKREDLDNYSVIPQTKEIIARKIRMLRCHHDEIQKSCCKKRRGRRTTLRHF
jgi:hypothetical protein